MSGPLPYFESIMATSDFDVLSYSPYVWLDATDTGTLQYADATHIERWYDKADNADASMNTAGNQPTYDDVDLMVEFNDVTDRMFINAVGNHFTSTTKFEVLKTNLKLCLNLC